MSYCISNLEESRLASLYGDGENSGRPSAPVIRDLTEVVWEALDARAAAP